MALFNRRNAAMGWAAWKLGKKAMKDRARGAMPGRRRASRRPGASTLASAGAALAGALWFWRKNRRTPEE